MNNYEALSILDKSWSKERLIEKIKKGQSSEQIVQEFINENKSNFDIVINLLNQKDNNILSYMEAIANCEINLINKLRNKENKENKSNIEALENITDINPIIKIYKEFKLSLFMKKWSNQFVIGILIMISIISLTKQAWA
tara:strand:+ start:131 stop:550 length:420 start_codon:yes stop_codon:yes gene_type:complete